MSEKVIIVAISLSEQERVGYQAYTTTVDKSLDELEELVNTAGGQVVARVIQKREAIHPKHYLGKGKIEEVRNLILYNEADTVICDDELSPAQITNLQKELSCKVVDRTILILDIFAAHAATKEGKLQVELAQLRYQSSRLMGLGNSMSRLGGGIGTRGPGESKLETDRRVIRDRISHLNKQLKDMVKNREVMRKQRSQNTVPLIAIVGYTNAGKSTLLNSLTDSNVIEKDMLFATLDPTTRAFTTQKGQKLLFTDTVGFISKLPHTLIKAFRSTLEEAKYADMILHVVDSSNEEKDFQMKVVYETLKELEIGQKKIITVFNKIDKISREEKEMLKDVNSDSRVCICAKEKQGFEELIEEIEKILNEDMVEIDRVIPYSQAGKIQIIREKGLLEKEEYVEDGIYIKGKISNQLFQKNFS